MIPGVRLSTGRQLTSTMQSAALSTASIYRRLTWQASVPLEIRLSDAEGEPSHGGGVERYYMQVPRHSYLPLIIQEVKENFVEAAVLADDLAGSKEADWWFEEDMAGEDEDVEPIDALGQPKRGESCPWHWPMDILHTRYLIATSRMRKPDSPSASSTPLPITPPLRLILHLRPPSSSTAETLYFIPNSIDSCRAQFMSQLKEADFVRWGNTRRVTGLRRLDLESGWEAIVQNDYDAISRFQTKIVPLPFAPTPTSISTTSSSSSTSDTKPNSNDSGGIGSAGAVAAAAGKGESVYSAKAVPVRFYLPGGFMHIQENVPPLQADGTPTTVIQMLRMSLTHLFPSDLNNASSDPFPLAIPLMSGVELPPEAEIGWLSSCCGGPDGWLRIGIRLVAVKTA